ncbi:DUF4340 domain-containing protein [Crocosphaera sp. XPORK-15E]|uniref:DUF4340 domain-containing protein n=1 Tax=Crocosphaera sp. XPORK-15E TaxID=3110247 RepID=UPI002B20C637|nr:DUF4340 domain-containing protein [Crocosphaera sp. XPORK-15E]MEA5537201.1 DUF4340 domain-containing protein [Crocosphaera sp. XPORK-15E]
MKLQKTTWGFLIAAILLATIVYVYESQINPKQEEIKSQTKKLFDFQEKEIKLLTIETQSQTMKFEKTEDNNQPWKMTKPKEKIANDAVVSFLTNLLVSSDINRTFTIDNNQKAEYGLDKPLATITVVLENKKSHQIIIGNPDFQGELLYAQVDPNTQPEGKITIGLVPKSFQYALERTPEEWILLEPKTDESQTKTNQDPKPTQEPKSSTTQP